MKLSYEEFVARIKEADIDLPPYLPFNIDGLFLYRDSPLETPLIAQTWVTGGVTGNSCYGNDPHPVRGETSPRGFAALSKALMAVVPNITFLQYQVIEEIVHSGTASDWGDYYGNYTEYGYNIVILSELYKKLVELELISP